MSQTAPENRGSAVAIRTVVSLVVVALGVWALFHVNPADAYLWIKSLHVIAVIAWMAGMLYLPRLFVYHCAAKPGSETSETFKVMEKRLLRFIINPAMIVTGSPVSGWLGKSSVSGVAGCMQNCCWSC